MTKNLVMMMRRRRMSLLISRLTSKLDVAIMGTALEGAPLRGGILTVPGKRLCSSGWRTRR